MEQNKKFLVITPTYNEIDNIEFFINSILEKPLSLLIIDDNSPDGTGRLVNNIKSKYKNLFSIHRDSKQGLGSAYREGFDWAIDNNYQFVVEMDADFSHRMIDLDSLIREAESSDLTIGSRYIKGGGSEGWDKKRKLLSYIANLVTKKIIGTIVNDLTSGFRVYNTSSLKNIGYEKIKSDGYSFQIEMVYLYYINKKTIKEVPILFEERRLGSSKMSKEIIFEAVKLLATLFIIRVLPHRKKHD